MKFSPIGRPILEPCNQILVQEFPDLKFAVQENCTYFNATSYLEKTCPNKTVDDFFNEYGTIIEKLIDPFELQTSDVCKVNQNTEILIEGHFAYLFISFVEPYFLAYMLDRINELMGNGFTVSDSYLVSASRQRLTKEILTEIINGQTGA